jgi:methylated-DNA-[protein]-cysteine S-methyltransferase
MIHSPVGNLKLVANYKALVAVLWENENPTRVRLSELVEKHAHPLLMKAEQQLNEYFTGRREDFSIALDMAGTPFQKSVWEALLAIPFGQTKTYLDVARHLGNPQATRAVGAATGRNPVSIIVPCHRVIGSTGKLTGFAGGLEAKAYLLLMEQRKTETRHAD